MRVMVIGPLNPDSFADNVSETLARMGHEVFAVGPARPRGIVAAMRTPMHVISDHLAELDHLRQRRLATLVKRLQPDAVLTLDRRLHKSVIAAAKDGGARTALWFPDHVSSMARHEMFISGYDRIYLKNQVLTERLQKIYGLPVAFLPEACNSNWHRPRGEYGMQVEVVMAGNIHPTRGVLVDRLLRDGVPLRIFGGAVARWIRTPALMAAHTGDYLARERKAERFRGARVVLNNLHPAEFAGMNCRLFEACGVGALVLTEARDGLGEAYRVGTEVETFDSYDELKEKLNWFLADRNRGQDIADAAARRSHSEHTYEHRISELLADLCG